MRELTTVFTTLLIILSHFQAVAQQEAHYTQFSYNNMLLNPGFAGARRVPSATALYRNQWMGYEGHPTSFLASFDTPLKKTRLGAGLTVSHQQEGIVSRDFANLALNYDVMHTEDVTFRIGMSGNVKKYRFDLQDPQIFVKNPGDAYLAQESPFLLKTNIGMGIYFDIKSFYIGFSSPNLIKNPIELNQKNTYDPYSAEQRHAYLQAGGFFRLGSESFHLKPSVMVKYVKNAPMSADLNLGLMYNRTFLLAGAFRTGNSKYGGNDAMSLMGFFQADDQLGIGAAYDFTLSQIKTVSSGSVEVLLRYDFIKNKKILHNPRYFF
jgi:type IX secretion system PorP/SprF family membrane protein